MRPVLHADVICAARVLLCLPSGRRWQAAQELVARAEAADRYRRRLGRTHPGWGNGTLMAAAMARPMAPGHRPDHPDYADCLMLVLDALRRTPHPTHAHLDLALKWIVRAAPRRAVLTNMHIDLDYQTVADETPEHITPAYDGMIIRYAV